jgi:hypothetical protein
MKKLIIAAALLVGIAAPAFAQSYSRDFGSGNVHAGPSTSAPGYAYAPAPHRTLHHHYRY